MDTSIVSVDGWTEMWTASAETAKAGEMPTKSVRDTSGLVTTFTTQCGRLSTRIYGELLEEVEGPESACHCKQLCIDKIDEGCRSWNYKVDDRLSTRIYGELL